MQRETHQASSGFRRSEERWAAPPFRFSFEPGAHALSVEAETNQVLGRGGHGLASWAATRRALGQIRRGWEGAGGAAAGPLLVSRLDLALDVAWPAEEWEPLRASLAGLLVEGFTTHHAAGFVAWDRPSGPRVKIYHRGQEVLRMETSYQGARALERMLGRGVNLTGVRLEDIEGRGKVLARACLAKALRLLQLSAGPADLHELSQAALAADCSTPGAALKLLGFLVADQALGRRAVQEALPDRTWHRFRSEARELFGETTEAGPAQELGWKVLAALYPWTAAAAEVVVEQLTAEEEALRLWLAAKSGAQAPKAGA